MKEVHCTRGFGLLEDEQTGETYNVEGDNSVEVEDDVAKRLKAQHSGVVVSEVEPEKHTCGVNDCSRTVDGPDKTCWQH